MRRQQLILHIISLVTGSLIYICFRTSTLVMFKWFDKLMLTGAITAIREYSLPFRDKLPSWFLYSLPDGLWMFSYICLMLFVWGRKMNMTHLFWFTLLPMIAILSEMGQLFQVVPGTFDIIDIVFYVAGSFLPFVIFRKNQDTREGLRAGNLISYYHVSSNKKNQTHFIRFSGSSFFIPCIWQR